MQMYKILKDIEEKLISWIRLMENEENYKFIRQIDSPLIDIELYAYA